MLIASNLKHLGLWEFDEKKVQMITVQMVYHMLHFALKQASYEASNTRNILIVVLYEILKITIKMFLVFEAS